MRLPKQGSKNFIDRTGAVPSYLDKLSLWLLKNGWKGDAAGGAYRQPWNPDTDEPESYEDWMRRTGKLRK